MKIIGFTGLGAMGAPMAGQLLQKGFPLHITAHHSRKALETLCAQGAKEADTVGAMARSVDVLVSMVPAAPQVWDVARQIIAAGPKPGLTLVDMSTISPTDAKAISEELSAHGVNFMDAPVSGGPFKAREGMLAIFAGASPEVFETHRDVLNAMGNPKYLGPVGSGQTVKLVNNSIVAAGMLALVEGLEMGKKAGIGLETLREVLLGASASSFLMETWIPKNYMKDDFSDGFAMKLMHKDLSCAMDLAADLGHPMPATSLAWQMYRQGLAKGLGGMDYSAVALLLRSGGDES